MNKKFLPIAFLTFVNTIGFSILIPVLPFITERYGASPFMYGLLLSAYSIFQFLATPLFGSLSDKYGRKNILILSQAGTLLSWVIFGIAYFLPDLKLWGLSLPILVILFSRITDGITGGNNSVANAYIADISDPKSRTKLYGFTGAIMGMGFIVGPVLGGYSTSFSIGYLGTVMVAGLISLITLLLIIFYLKESLPPEKRDKDLHIHLWTEINVLKKAQYFKENKAVIHLFWRRLVFAFAFSCFTSTFALYAKDYLHLNPKSLGLVMLVVGLFSVFNNVFVTPRVAKKLGESKTFTVGQITLGISMALLFFAPTLIWFIVLMYLTNLGMGLSLPTFKSMLTSSVTETQQGRVTGVDESIAAGSNGIAPLMAGWLYGSLTLTAFPIFASVIFIPYVLWGMAKKNKG